MAFAKECPHATIFMRAGLRTYFHLLLFVTNLSPDHVRCLRSMQNRLYS